MNSNQGLPDLEALRETFKDPMRDIKLNLEAVLGTPGVLNPEQRWGVALACAAAARNAELTRAVLLRARANAGAALVDDAFAAAALMSMNNVFYRFRHQIQKSTYAEMPARLRMTRLARPATNKRDFELFCLAVSAINGCETCVRAHEEAVLSAGMSEAHVHEAVRIAATLHASALSLELSSLEVEAQHTSE